MGYTMLVRWGVVNGRGHSETGNDKVGTRAREFSGARKRARLQTPGL